MKTLNITPRALTFAQLREVYDKPVKVSLDDNAYEKIEQSQQAVQKIIAQDKSAYGINTGFGLLARTRISHDQLELLQHNLIVSHS